jgi:hypothetical protein
MSIDITKICNKVLGVAMSPNCVEGQAPGRPQWMMLGVYGTSITMAGTTPTPTEVQTYIDAGNAILFPMTNGVKLQGTPNVKTGADTFNGGSETKSETTGITGNIFSIGNDTLEIFKKNNLNNRQCQMWWIDEYNQFHGCDLGYLVDAYIGDFGVSDIGEDAMISIEKTWKVVRNTYLPYSTPDTGFATLTNYVSEGTYTETVETDYVAGQVTGYNNIIGWDKTTYPTVYLTYTAGSIEIFAEVGRTTSLATIDLTDSDLPVTEAGGSGFGGSIDYVSPEIVASSTWNVAYSA